MGTVSRLNGVSYLQIPAPDPLASGDFYRAVFGWQLRGDPDAHLSFEDGTGDVIGAFIRDLPVAGDAGLLPYVYVDDVEAAVERVKASGGSIVKEPYWEPPDAEDHLTVATFMDVAGNVLGLWQKS
jgi:predicted enzyme related to lactoylglutathione lyase